MKKKSILVTGAGGFIGHHLVNRLAAEAHAVRGADIKLPEFENSAADDFHLGDLRSYENCLSASKGMEEIYHLAADMGGIGYITSSHAGITLNNTLINANMIRAARQNGVKRFLFSSSACIYPRYLQEQPEVTPLREESAFPADPEEGYGLEKLFMEKLCEYFLEDWDFPTRVVRFHNVYGPLGTYQGGKEKAPAAICRKIAHARAEDTIEIWGDGKQTRSFMYIDDCVEGLLRIMQSDHAAPLNLGSDELVTIDDVVDVVSEIAGKRLSKRYDLSKPQGVRGRNSDNSRLKQVLGWTPTTSIRDGLRPTYAWIAEQCARKTPVAAE